MTEPVPEIPALPDACWPVDHSCCVGWDDYTPEIKARADALATQTLRMLTAYQVGGCPVTVRPCLRKCFISTYQDYPVYGGYGSASGPFSPHINAGGQWVNSCGCAGPDNCSCTQICEIDLPGPVGEVTEVRLNGEVLEPSMYRVDDYRKLVRLPMGRVHTGSFFDCVPNIPNAVCLVTPSGDQIQVGGNDFDISPDGETFTLLSNEPFAVVFGRGRISPQVTMTFCPGAVVSWTNAVASEVTSNFPLVSQTLSDFTVGAVETTVTISFPSAPTPNSTTTPVFTITAPDGCARMDIGALSFIESTPGVCWPLCQDMNADPLTDPDTFSVTYLNGWKVDGLGSYAAGILACEFAKACAGKPCKLPPNVTNVSRLGVTLELSTDVFPGGLTGIREVDQWVRRWNPYGLVTAPRVWYPGMRAPRITTWQG